MRLLRSKHFKWNNRIQSQSQIKVDWSFVILSPCFIQHNVVLDFCLRIALTFLMSPKTITKFDVQLIPVHKQKLNHNRFQILFGFVDSEIFIYLCYFECKLSMPLFCTAVHVFYIIHLQYLLKHFVVYFLWEKWVWHVSNICLHAFNSVNALFTELLIFSYTQKIFAQKRGARLF